MASRMLLLALIVFSVAGSKAAPATQPPAPTQACDTRKTNNGGCCVFPFIYLGKTYYDCTTKNLNNAWCATTANYDKNSDKWGQCDNSTPIFDEILQSNADKNEAKERAQYSVKLFQGDIVVDAGIQSFLNSRGLPGPGRTKRAVMRNDRQRWMINGKGVVPYVIESSNYHVRGVILRAIKHWESKVPCLKFVRYTRSSQGRYLSFFSGGGCYSLVGRQGNSGRQRISIGRGCGHMGVVAHEIGHALGFWHEQSRPDRDRYVTINWRNIQSGVAYNFHKYDTRKINSRGVSYDYNSVMHYSSTAFSRGRGLYTIVGKDGRTNLGQRYGLSAKDVIQANKLYCGSDPRPPTHRPPTHRPPTPPPPGCRYRDNHRWCPYWKSRGFCTGKHSGYMRQKCQKSCYCRQSQKCVDKFSICSTWARRGYCTRYGPYTKVYCKKSCKVC